MKRMLAMLLAALLLSSAALAEENPYEKYDALLALLEAGDTTSARQEFDRICAELDSAEAEGDAAEAETSGAQHRLGETLEGAGLAITFGEAGVTEGKPLFSIHGSPYRLKTRQENSSLVYAYGEITGLGKLSGELGNHLWCEFLVDGEAVPGSFGTEEEANREMGYSLKVRDPQAFWMCASVYNDWLRDDSSLVLRLGFRENPIDGDDDSGLSAETCDAVYEIDLLAQPVERVAEAEPAGAPESYTDQATVKAAQVALNALGYDCGTPDGLPGKKTAAAISSAQKDFGLTETGTLTRELLEKLGVAIP